MQVMQPLTSQRGQRGHLCAKLVVAVESFAIEIINNLITYLIPPKMAGLRARIGFEKFQKSDKLGRAGLRSVLMAGKPMKHAGPPLLALFKGFSGIERH